MPKCGENATIFYSDLFSEKFQNFTKRYVHELSIWYNEHVTQHDTKGNLKMIFARELGKSLAAENASFDEVLKIANSFSGRIAFIIVSSYRKQLRTYAA